LYNTTSLHDIVT